MAAAVDPFSDPTPAPAEKSSSKDILAAVRDVVTVKTDRLKVPRSQSGQGSPNGTPPTSRRAVSDESIAKSAERKSKPKKAGGAHTDVIDKLDFTGIGVATLHHDGPFDACAPSRNVQKHKAPMAAWSPRDEQDFTVPPVPPPNDSRISQRAQATMAAMAQISPGFDSGPYPSSSLGDSGPYPRIGAGRGGGGFDEWGTAPPKKRHDALAEAWGMHEPEPFEEFMAGGGEHSRPASIRNGVDSAKKGRDAYAEERPARRREPRTKLPPPAPIALPGQVSYEDEVLAASNYSSSFPEDNAPKRSKSLLNRIKKMKANPNIPLSATEETRDASPPRADGQALGRPSSQFETLGPSSPGLPTLGPSGTTVPRGEKKEDEYFERPANATGVGAMPQSPGSAGLGRKPSLMQKIRGATRGKQQPQQP